MLRPEEAELAADRDSLLTSFLGYGQVEELQFTGALERLRLRMVTEDQIPGAEGLTSAVPPVWIDVTRTQPEQRSFPLLLGQQVAVGTRRIHVLPTPLSSFTVCAPVRDEADRLVANPWLIDLATRMQTRLSIRVEPLRSLDLPPATTLWQKCRQGWPWSPPDRIALKRFANCWLGGHAGALSAGGCEHSKPGDRPFRRTSGPAYHSGSNRQFAKTHAGRSRISWHSAGGQLGTSPHRRRPAVARRALGSPSRTRAGCADRIASGERIQELLRELATQPGQMLILGLPEPGWLPESFEDLLTQSPGWPVLLA